MYRRRFLLRTLTRSESDAAVTTAGFRYPVSAFCGSRSFEVNPGEQPRHVPRRLANHSARVPPEYGLSRLPPECEAQPLAVASQCASTPSEWDAIPIPATTRRRAR